MHVNPTPRTGGPGVRSGTAFYSSIARSLTVPGVGYRSTSTPTTSNQRCAWDASSCCTASTRRWVLRDVKRRGMRPPVVAVGDSALGFWAAVRDVWPNTREQRDWFHKLGNILDMLPKAAPAPREGGAPRGDVRRDPRAGARGGHTVRRRVRPQVPEGGED